MSVQLLHIMDDWFEKELRDYQDHYTPQAGAATPGDSNTTLFDEFDESMDNIQEAAIPHSSPPRPINFPSTRNQFSTPLSAPPLPRSPPPQLGNFQFKNENPSASSPHLVPFPPRLANLQYTDNNLSAYFSSPPLPPLLPRPSNNAVDNTLYGVPPSRPLPPLPPRPSKSDFVDDNTYDAPVARVLDSPFNFRHPVNLKNEFEGFDFGFLNGSTKPTPNPCYDIDRKMQLDEMDNRISDLNQKILELQRQVIDLRSLPTYLENLSEWIISSKRVTDTAFVGVEAMMAGAPPRRGDANEGEASRSE